MARPRARPAWPEGVHLVEGDRIYREAAVAAFFNARELHEEAEILHEARRLARALALARIGLEEFAKAVVYTIAAANAKVAAEVKALKALRFHEPKQFLTGMVDGVIIELDQYWSAVESEARLPMTAQEQLIDVLVQLIREPLPELLPPPEEARKYYELLEPSPWHGLRPNQWKDAALYVDVAAGQVLGPARVAEHAPGEILGLEYYLQRFEPLPHLLTNAAAWRQLLARL